MDSKLRKMIAEVLGMDENLIDSEIAAENEPRWDSLRHMNLIFALEDAYGIRFSDDEIPELTSVRAIENALARRG